MFKLCAKVNKNDHFCSDCGKKISIDNKIERTYPSISTINHQESTNTKTSKKLAILCLILGVITLFAAAIILIKINTDNKTTDSNLVHIHAPANIWKSDNEYHWQECSCGEIVNKESHSGGGASCISKATCNICNSAYGEVDTNKHGEPELRNVKEASDTEEGYTGDTYCKDCEVILSIGQITEQIHTHAPAEKWYNDNENHWQECSCGEIIDKNKHSGGTATCSSKATCGVCKAKYGELNPQNHKETETRNAKNATGTESGYTGDTYCKQCNKKLSEGQIIEAQNSSKEYKEFTLNNVSYKTPASWRHGKPENHNGWYHYPDEKNPGILIYTEFFEQKYFLTSAETLLLSFLNSFAGDEGKITYKDIIVENSGATMVAIVNRSLEDIDYELRVAVMWYEDVLYCFTVGEPTSISKESQDNFDSVIRSIEYKTNDVSTTKKDDREIDSNFKAAMDSYEKFMNEYIAFMKKYMDNPSDFSLITEYAEYMTKYAEFVADFKKWEDEELTTAELAYYIDVQARINKKLLEISE